MNLLRDRAVAHRALVQFQDHAREHGPDLDNTLATLLAAALEFTTPRLPLVRRIWNVLTAWRRR